MATLRDIRRRIRSVESTKKITRAMKLVAAAKLRRAQDRIVSARPYAGKMVELLGNLVAATRGGHDEPAHPLLAAREGPRRLVVVVTADRGLAGAFSANLIRRALEVIRESNTQEVALVTVGRKGRDFFRRRTWPVEREQVGFWDRLDFSHAQELADYLVQRYLEGHVDHVEIVYNEFRSVAAQRPVRQQLLPIPAAEGEAADEAAVDYLYEPSPEAILDDLLPRSVRVQVYRALMESIAGEHGARMTAMEAASKNATEMIEVLSIQYNKARQEKITKELLDIVGGAEALAQQRA